MIADKRHRRENLSEEAGQSLETGQAKPGQIWLTISLGSNTNDDVEVEHTGHV